MSRFKLILVLILAVCATLYSYTRSRDAAAVEYRIQWPDSVFQSGDIIFRDGRGAISAIFRNMSRTDRSYSHAGIIHREGKDVYVYHVIGGEAKKSEMRRERLMDFCNRREAYSFAVYRSGLDGAAIDSVAGSYFRQHLPFDDKFDISSDDKMYCTELVYKILTRVSKVDNFLPLTTVRNITYCSCDNIFLSPELTKVYSYKYK